jgi:calcineurin-like phosphoesterase family protein
MSKVWLSSDYHFGHKAICKYRDQFKTPAEHDEHIMEEFCKVVGKRDITYFLGDMAFTEEGLEKIATLPGRKRLIMGNHCFQHYKGTKARIAEVFDEVYGSKKYKGVWLTHIPIHESELRGNYCIHGHGHDFEVDDDRYISVCLEKTDYKPVEFKDVFAKLAERCPDYEKG